MADDWEDWENDDFTPQLPAAPATDPVAASDDVEQAKFAGEDEEEEQPKYNVPKPQQVLDFLPSPVHFAPCPARTGGASVCQRSHFTPA